MPPPSGRSGRVQKFLPSSDESENSSSANEEDAARNETRVETFTVEKKRQSVSGTQDQLMGLNDHAKPPIKPRKKSSSSTKHSRNGSKKSASRDRLTGLFTMDKMAYDVVLEEMTLTLNLCEGQARNAGERRKSLSKQNSKSDLLASQSVVIPINKIYAANIVRTPQSRAVSRRNSTDGSGEAGQIVPGSCQGMMILTYERKETSCKFQERAIFLKHPSEVICQEWVDKFKAKMASFKERPRKLMVMIQVFSGRKNTRDLYHEKVKPVLKTTRCDIDIVELDHKEHIKQLVTHLDWDEYDCLVVLGGDGTVKTLVHHLLCRVQEDHHVNQDPSFTPVPCRLPIGVIPAGTTNHIATTMHGTDDIYTACVHIVLGHRFQVDIASIFLEDKFRRWAFTSHYGLLGNVQRYTDKSKSRQAAILDHAHGKALAKNKLRGYECEIRYIPVDDEEAGDPMDENTCRIGCELCRTVDPSTLEEESSDDEDEVTAFDPLAQSGNSTTLADMKSPRDPSPSRWRTMKGSFMNVSVFCNPNMCEQAPQGLSKYSHYSDGAMDLVCVHETSRKDVIRYLKRGGTSKNQFDFPFVETMRVRQVKLHQRVDTTWKHKDYEYDEMDYQASKRRMSKSKTTDGVRVLGESDDSDADSSDPDGEDEDAKSSNRDDTSSKANDDEEDSEDDRKKKEKEKPKKEKTRLKIFSRQGSLLDLARRSPKWEKETKSLKQRRLSEPRAVSKTSLSDIEAKKRKEKKTKKEKKQKEKDVSRMRAVWSVDGDLEYESDLHMRVHHRLIVFAGLGIFEDAELGDCRFHYLPVY